MLNMSIILFRYKQFASKIYNAVSMYYFLCKLITDLQNSIHFITGLLLYKLKLTAVRLKMGTAQWFRLANSARIFINLSWYERKSYAQKFGSVRQKKSEVQFGSGSAKKFLVRSFPTPTQCIPQYLSDHRATQYIYIWYNFRFFSNFENVKIK